MKRLAIIVALLAALTLSASPQRPACLPMPINRVIVFDDSFPWTQDAFEQMFPPGKCDENHTQTRKSVVE